MLRACIAALACLSLVRTSAAEHSLRAHAHALHTSKDLIGVLSTIDERLRILETISAVQVKQARRIDVIQDKLERVETTLSLKLERAHLAAERLEHRLHMLQTSVETSIKDSSIRVERSQSKIAEITRNLTSDLDSHRRLLEKVSGAYAESWHRGLVLESLMRDGLSLINVTRRELADGLRGLARRHRADPRIYGGDLEAAFTRRLNDNTYKLDLKMQEVIDAQKRFIDSCQREQLDDPTHVADVLYKLIDSLVNKTAATFRELQSIHITMRGHDSRVMKVLSAGRNLPMEPTCKRLESAFRNVTHGLQNSELLSLTEKFVALTDRADAALQRLEIRLGDDTPTPGSDISAEADKLFQKLKGIKSEKDDDEDEGDDDDDDDWEEDSGYFDDGGGGDMMEEDKRVLNAAEMGISDLSESTTTRIPHRRHLHKHPYDRGPMWRNLP